MRNHRTSHAGGGGVCGRSSAMSRKIIWNICRAMATSAIWTGIPQMNPELVADDSDLLGFPEVVGPFVAGRLQSGLGSGVLGSNNANRKPTEQWNGRSLRPHDQA